MDEELPSSRLDARIERLLRSLSIPLKAKELSLLVFIADDALITKARKLVVEEIFKASDAERFKSRCQLTHEVLAIKAYYGPLVAFYGKEADAASAAEEVSESGFYNFCTFDGEER